MRIAVFDYYVTETNPIGSCHLKLLQGTSEEHSYTVFAVRFDNPDPDRIHWVRVPVPRRPLALLFLAYHIVAPVCYALYRLRGGQRFELVQGVESNLALPGLAYTHFCHRAFLRTDGRPKPLGGLRTLLRWCDHKFHALLEPLVYRRVRTIVVPSRGLAGELHREYPVTRGRTSVIPNPVDVERMRMGADFDRPARRAAMGLGNDDVVFVFVALGHFERKGLPLLIDAVAETRDSRLKVLVVGGEPDLVRSYGRKARSRRVESRVQFVGMQKDVRPYLHAADVFVLPSAYEAFPLVALEAAAAGLPLLVTPVNGIEEFVRDGRNGFMVDRTVPALASGMSKLLATPADERAAMGENAREDVSGYTLDHFISSWRGLYTALADRRTSVKSGA